MSKDTLGRGATLSPAQQKALRVATYEIEIATKKIRKILYCKDESSNTGGKK